MLAEKFATGVRLAAEKNLSVIDLLSLIDQLNTAGEKMLARALYAAWLENNRENPLSFAMFFNYGVFLSNNGDLPGARNAHVEAIKINPEFYPPYINLGHTLERMGMTGEGVQQWYALLDKLPAITGDNVGYKVEALKQIGRVLEGAYMDETAESALRFSLDINHQQNDVIQHWISLRMRQCKWPVIEPWGKLTKAKLLDGISALSLAAYTDDPFLLLGNAYRYAKNNIGRPATSFADRHASLLKNRPADRLRIGYLSSDLREHAIGFLTAEMYELHDRKKVEVFAYYCGHEVNDNIQARIKSGCDHWINLTGMSDEAAGEKICSDRIDILVDINGYTQMARTKLLSMRPAPIIVNWLGFPGTAATPYHNYIVADEFIIPRDSEHYYAEKVLRLPCYQPNDRKREISTVPATRSQAGLPENAVVYCCFNGVHKITKFVWARWMDILRQVPGSVLWLLEGSETVIKRLREHAAAHRIEAERIVFAGKMRNPDHLARYVLADLFLDTSPYGAHTTSSDAMWMGVPVLTLVGRSFAARVCGSLVKSAGLDDMICKTPEDYVAKAVALGRSKEQRDALRRRLRENRATCVLFDTQLLVSKLEELYAVMWQDYKAGRLPRPDLSNLDIYADIGIELDNNDVELLLMKDYEQHFKQALAERNEFCYLPPDKRIWRGETAMLAAS